MGRSGGARAQGNGGSVPRPGISVAMASLPVKEACGTYRDLQGPKETRVPGLALVGGMQSPGLLR